MFPESKKKCLAGAPQLLGAIAADDAIPFLKFLTRKKKKRKPGQAASSSRGDAGSIASDASLLFGGGAYSLAYTGGSSLVEVNSVAANSESSADIECQNSKRAVWFTWAIASIGTLLGNIDHITPILTMFYLMMYGGINLCCFLLAWVDSPGFRPQ